MVYTLIVGLFLTVLAVVLPEFAQTEIAPNRLGVAAVGIFGTGLVAVLQYRLKKLRASAKRIENE